MRRALVFAALFVLVAAVRASVVSFHRPVLMPDSESYLADARTDWGTLFHNWVIGSSRRPILYPAILKLAGATDAAETVLLRRMIVIQWLLGAAAFSALTWRVCLVCVRTTLARLSAGIVVLAVSLSWFVGPWDSAVMTESLMTSSLAAVGFFLLSAGERGRLRRVLGLTAVLVATLCLRDVAVLYVLCILAVGAGRLVWGDRTGLRQARVARIGCGVALGCAALLATGSAYRANRSAAALTNALSRRVLPAPERFEWFVGAAGLPRDVEPLVGRFAWDGWTDHGDYATWATGAGRGAYADFLIRHPAYVGRECIGAFARVAHDAAGGDLEHYFVDHGRVPARIRFSAAVSQAVAGPFQWAVQISPAVAWAGWLVVTAAAGWVWHRSGNRAVVVVAASMALIVVCQGLATRFLDACEDARHNLAASFLMVTAFWIGLIAVVEHVFLSARARDGLRNR